MRPLHHKAGREPLRDMLRVAGGACWGITFVIGAFQWSDDKEISLPSIAAAAVVAVLFGMLAKMMPK